MPSQLEWDKICSRLDTQFGGRGGNGGALGQGFYGTFNPKEAIGYGVQTCNNNNERHIVLFEIVLNNPDKFRRSDLQKTTNQQLKQEILLIVWKKKIILFKMQLIVKY